MATSAGLVSGRLGTLLMTDEREPTNGILPWKGAEPTLDEEAELSRLPVRDEVLVLRLRFEHGLKAAVKRAMCEAVPTAPPGLADRIRTGMAVAAAAEVVGNAAGEYSEPEESPDFHKNPVSEAGSWKDERGRGRSRGGTLSILRPRDIAVAASIALLIGGIWLGIPGPFLRGEDVMVQTVHLVSGLHGMCISEPDRLRTLASWDEPEGAQAKLALHLGSPSVRIVDLSQLGFEFFGGGACKVPGPEPSGHMFFERPAEASESSAMGDADDWVSIFVVPNTGHFDSVSKGVPPLNWFELERSDGSVYKVLGVSDPGSSLLYFLVCPDQQTRPAVIRAIEESLTQ